MKRATNLSVDEVLLDEAKAYGINLSETLTEALETRVREERARRWREENAEAIESYNKRIDEHGTFGEDFRSF
ncbi:MAG: type II toxin-antitoxin system CcdA family antitoxin [Hyphomicrobiaceae bacterium]